MRGEQLLDRQVRRFSKRPKCRESLKRAEILDQERYALHALAHPPLKLLASSTSQIARDEQTITKHSLGILDGLKCRNCGQRESGRPVRVIGRPPDSPIVDQ